MRKIYTANLTFGGGMAYMYAGAAAGPSSGRRGELGTEQTFFIIRVSAVFMRGTKFSEPNALNTPGLYSSPSGQIPAMTSSS